MATSSPSPQLPASPNVSTDLEAPPSSLSLDPSKAPSTGNLIEAEVVNYQSALGVYVEESEHLNPDAPPPPRAATQADSFWRRSFVALVVSLVVVLVVVIVVLVVVGVGGDDDGDQSKNLPTLPTRPPLPTMSPTSTSLATASPTSDSDDAATPTSSPTIATSPTPTSPQTWAPTSNPTAAPTSAPSTAMTLPPTNNPTQASSDIQEYREEAAWEIATATMSTVLGEDLNQLRANWTPPDGGIVAVTNRLPLVFNGSGLTFSSTVFGRGGPIRFVSGSYQGNLTFVAPVDESTFLSFELRNRINPVDGFNYRDVALGFSAPIRAFGFDYRIVGASRPKLKSSFKTWVQLGPGGPWPLGLDHSSG